MNIWWRNMKIQDQDFYHGAALTQIVEHESFKALNRASRKYGHYLINTDRHIFVKYRKSKKTPWLFTIQPDELKALGTVLLAGHKTYLCLVCGSTTVCAVHANEIHELIDVSSPEAQWVRVDVPDAGSCHVSGSIGNLKRVVPHKSFPTKVFE
jgi:hypothetical protein